MTEVGASIVEETGLLIALAPFVNEELRKA
jgi:hypothetical protein